MTSWECYENKWFYMKYIGKMAETESLLSTCCITFLDKFKVNYTIFYDLPIFIQVVKLQAYVKKN
jgi:hypothetical protein